MVKSYGPAKLPKAKMTPFQSGGGPPPAPGGVTAPMPVAIQPRGIKIDKSTVPIQRDFFPPKRVPPAPPPPQVEPQRKPKQKAIEQAVGKKPGAPVPEQMGKSSGVPEQMGKWSGATRKLPDDVVNNARQRMIEIARRHQQQTTRKQDFAKLVENEKKHRRGGELVTLGKRKEPGPDMPRSMLRKAAPQEGPRSRQRVYGPGTQVFNIGT